MLKQRILPQVEFQLDFAGLIRDSNELGFLSMIPSWKA
jgi:hypothetical protein